MADTGPGIEAQDLERIFEPFERADAGGRVVPGTGLGLTITRLLTEILGGDLRVSSVPGRGSVFTARIMLLEISATAAGEAAPGRLIGYEGRRRTILAADDEPAHRQLLEELLLPIGFNVLSVESSAACLQIASAAEPDLLILDVNMPGMNGWELAGELRRRDIAAPVLLLSADRRPASPDLRLCDEWVEKPVAVAALLAGIRRLLDLTWLHEDVAIGIAPRGETELEAFEIPGGADRRDLAEMIAIGYVRGIHAKLDEIGSREPRTQRFVARVRSRLDHFDMDACLALVEGGLDDG